MEPEFFYDFNSPFAYLAAMRVDDVLPMPPRWRPIAFGILLRETGRRPWSFGKDTRPAGQAEIARRAAARGLPPVVYPEGWPVGSYSLAPLRAALVAEDAGLLREFSHAMYLDVFARGRSPVDVDNVIRAAGEVGLDPAAVREGISSEDVKARLRDATDEAIARGAVGVPTVAVGDELFWGDDRLEDAAALLAGA